MPNWCNNFMEFKGKSEAINKLKEDIKKSIEKRSDTLMEDLTGIKISEENWYEERLTNFGCKWDFDADEFNTTFNENSITLVVATAWSPPVQFLSHLCKKYGVMGFISYSEPGCDFGGIANVNENGEVEEVTYGYMEHLYLNESETFWVEIESNIEYSFENGNCNWDKLKKDYSFVSEDTMTQIKDLFDDISSQYESDEQ